MTEPSTLYKLMILYMLKKVNFPLSNPQLWTFFEQKGYTNFFVFSSTVSELLEANLIKKDEVRSVQRYELTREGEEAQYYFKRDIPEGVRTDMDEFISENKFQLRNETGVIADYHKTENFDWQVHCEVREGNAVVFEINLTVPTDDLARVIAGHWKDNAQSVYADVMNRLM